MGLTTDLLAFQAKKEAGKIEELEMKTAATQEELAATQRESERKRSLSEALSSQIAASGASGVSAFEGSPLTIMQEDIARQKAASRTDAFNTGLASLSLRTRGKVARKQAKLGATLGLIQSVESRATASSPKGG